jgi:integrase/recombinase XerD
MKASKAVKIWLDYHHAHSRPSTARAYEQFISTFDQHYGHQEIEDLTPNDILEYMNRITEGLKPNTIRTKFAFLHAFFNFIRFNIYEDFINPCDTKMLRKLFRPREIRRWDILEKEMVDEIIFRTLNNRNRLMLELMARGGMRIGEVLKLRAGDLQDRKLVLRDPKSGRGVEFAFIPQKVADRLKEYANQKCKDANERIFPIGYEAARRAVAKSGRLVGIKLCPHDLRRHAATFASRSGVPLEVVSKVILRHANIATTQLYLGKISHTEAHRWIDTLYS